MAIVNILRSFDTSSGLALLLEFIPFLRKTIPDFVKYKFNMYKTLRDLTQESRKLMKVSDLLKQGMYSGTHRLLGTKSKENIVFAGGVLAITVQNLRKFAFSKIAHENHRKMSHKLFKEM